MEDRYVGKMAKGELREWNNKQWWSLNQNVMFHRMSRHIEGNHPQTEITNEFKIREAGC